MTDWRPESDALHARVRSVVHAFAHDAETAESFDTLALALGRFQARHVPGYLRLCARSGVDPASCPDVGRLPAVPTDAFKSMRVASFPEQATTHSFQTSGTTSGARGRHELRDIATYEAGALTFGRASLTAGTPMRVLILGPSPSQAPDSSLTHMCALFARELGPRAATAFFLHDEIFDLAALDQQIAHALVANERVLLLGTSFAFVHVLDALGDERVPLPEGSRIMQTGGFKGRTREIAADQLRRQIASTFAVDERAVVQEYGMTELSSQFYERTAVDPHAERGVLCEPPWARVVPVDACNLQPVAFGEEGIARIEDLCNVDSAFAVQTADRVRRVRGGFVLLGRLPGSAPRGCSLAIDELLAGRS